MNDPLDKSKAAAPKRSSDTHASKHKLEPALTIAQMNSLGRAMNDAIIGISRGNETPFNWLVARGMAEAYEKLLHGHRAGEVSCDAPETLAEIRARFTPEKIKEEILNYLNRENSEVLTLSGIEGVIRRASIQVAKLASQIDSAGRAR